MKQLNARSYDGVDQHAHYTHFGAFLKSRRDLWGVKQQDVLAHLPGWTQTNYSRVESGDTAPAFEQLRPIYAALHQAGIEWTLPDRQHFIDLARKRVERKKSHREHLSDADWAELRFKLSQEDQFPDELTVLPSSLQVISPRLTLAETRHLVGREEWLSGIIDLFRHEEMTKKLIVLQGPIGMGKSSELRRLARHFLRSQNPSPLMIWHAFSPVERVDDPPAALDEFLGMVSSAVNRKSTAPFLQTLSALERTTSVLSQLERSAQSVLIFIDNAECLLEGNGTLSLCWQDFLELFLRCEHRATLFLATKEWPGWTGRDRMFVAETILPPLTMDTSVLLLQHLGLEAVPLQYLQKVSTHVGNIPLCLEWVAILALDPLLLDDWEAYDHDRDVQEDHLLNREGQDATQRIIYLLAEPSLLGNHIATKLYPLLERIVEKRLSTEARTVMNSLAVSNVPLGKEALKVICRRPSLLKELRDASLLVAYPQRIQLLPMVASTILPRLPSEMVWTKEEQLIAALTRWLDQGIVSEHEKGDVLSELISLHIHHHHLLAAAEMLIQHLWLSFHVGKAFRLARLAQDTIGQFDWRASAENRCGAIFLRYHLAPFLGKRVTAQARFEAYQPIESLVSSGLVQLQPQTAVHLLHHLMQYHINMTRFAEAQTLFDACKERMGFLLEDDPELLASLLGKQAWLLGTWSDNAAEQGYAGEARIKREQTIAVYRQCICLIQTEEEQASSLKMSTIKKRLARFLNDLGYYLHQSGQYEEALAFLEQCIELKEQGFVEPGSLAASYGEKSQVLASLGRFREALSFDQLAIDEIQKQVKAGHSLSQEDQWTYQVNRARLYLLLGRVDEAERLLQDADLHISERRRIYKQRAQTANQEIREWRLRSPELQLDWRWSARFREHVSYNMFRWLAHAGPFTEEEQREWQQLAPRDDEEALQRMAAIVNTSRERELATAFQQHREPNLRYPAIPLEEVRQRIASLLQLDHDVRESEPNVIVRRLYTDAIAQELWNLRMMEATAEGENNTFWTYNRRIHAEPNGGEMDIAISEVAALITQGLQRQDTVDVSQHLLQRLHALGLPLRAGEEKAPGSATRLQHQVAGSEVRSTPRMVSPLLLRAFFNAVLKEYGLDDWKATIEATAKAPRIEQSIRQVILPEEEVSIERARQLLAHELESHVFRSSAGERSPLALLGIGTKNFLETEEGLALYYDREIDRLKGNRADSVPISVWMGTLATGLASGVITPPQTFWALCALLEDLLVLYRQLYTLDASAAASKTKAHDLAMVRCLRTFRGVPNLSQPGYCYTKDALYLRGLLSVTEAVEKDRAILERLMVGMVGLEQLPDMEELEIRIPLNRPRWLARRPDLEEYILSFENPLHSSPEVSSSEEKSSSNRSING